MFNCDENGHFFLSNSYHEKNHHKTTLFFGYFSIDNCVVQKTGSQMNVSNQRENEKILKKRKKGLDKRREV